jgi:hypothetical protein
VEAAGLPVVPDGAPVVAQLPGEAPFELQLHRRGERRRVEPEVGAQEAQEVVRRRADGAGAGEHRQIPGGHGRARGVVRLGEARAIGRRERDARRRHPQRFGDPLG